MSLKTYYNQKHISIYIYTHIHAYVQQKQAKNHHRHRRCQDFIAAAKDGEWDQLREILGRHPGYAGAPRVKGFSGFKVTQKQKKHRLE